MGIRNLIRVPLYRCSESTFKSSSGQPRSGAACQGGGGACRFLPEDDAIMALPQAAGDEISGEGGLKGWTKRTGTCPVGANCATRWDPQKQNIFF